MSDKTLSLFMPPDRFEERIKGKFLAVAHGGGVNSSAMLLAFLEREIRPDFIAFADTGGERPETYSVVRALSAHLERAGFPAILTVRKRPHKHADTTLEAECIRAGTLPSKAFGWGTCSDKWKAQPQNIALRANPMAREEWKAGRKVIKCIGFDAGEARRAKYPCDKRFLLEYPLIEWGVFREDCVAICDRHGFTIPKSSCFFCPSMRKPEILELRDMHPDLLARALAIEAKAKPNLITVNGLGRRLNWADFLASESSRPELDFSEPPEQDCGCYDG